jgi:hypothetical protein
VENVNAGASGQIETAADFANLVVEIERSPVVQPTLAAQALSAVRRGVITGEGPTTTGRIHFSRCIDSADTALVSRILLAGDRYAVTRAEADALFDINDAAFERTDGGAFVDLLVKAIAHHVLAAAGHRVPCRTTALAATTELTAWAVSEVHDADVGAWLMARLRRHGRQDAKLAALAALVGARASWTVPTLAFDLAA